MYNKIKNFSETCWKEQNMIRIAIGASIFWIVLICILITANHNWHSLFVYPEQDYHLIQAEADRIISNHDFNTTYRLTINNYSNVYHSLSFDLSNDEGTRLTATVHDYGLETEEISYKRMDKSHISQVLKSVILLLILIPIFLGVFSMYGFLIIVLIFQFISFIVYQIVSAIFEKVQ